MRLRQIGCKLSVARCARGVNAGIKVSKAELAAINIERHHFHGEWNYTIKPNNEPI
ncbi:MAG: hypothetical protein AB7U95_26635 [Reyranella sp.]